MINKPGQFARVSANVGPVQPRVIVPQQSVSQAQGVNSVWVVRPDSTAAYRRVVLGDTYGTMWCVDEGLAEGGLQTVQPYSSVCSTAPKVPLCGAPAPNVTAASLSGHGARFWRILPICTFGKIP